MGEKWDHITRLSERGIGWTGTQMSQEANGYNELHVNVVDAGLTYLVKILLEVWKWCPVDIVKML